MQLYPRRRNVAARVAEELKTVTYTTPPIWRNAEKNMLLSFFFCEAVSDNKTGGSCTTGDGANTKGSCLDPHALCSGATSGTCSCKAGFTGTDGAGCGMYLWCKVLTLKAQSSQTSRASGKG